MTPAQAAALAEELAREYENRAANVGYPLSVLSPTVGMLVQEAVAKAIDRALSSVRPPSRVESAEKAVVEAAVKWRDAEMEKRKQPLTNADSDYLDKLLSLELEAVDRLRDLRKSIGEPECRAHSMFQVAPRDERGVDLVRSDTAATWCDQPRGHEGDHRGPLGEWTWPNRGEG